MIPVGFLCITPHLSTYFLPIPSSDRESQDVAWVSGRYPSWRSGKLCTCFSTPVDNVGDLMLAQVLRRFAEGRKL